MHHTIERVVAIFLRGTVCAILLLIGLAVPSPRSVALAAGCSGSGCMGLNPSTMGCGADAYTYIWGEFADGSVVENRHSSTCNAEWDRTTNDSGGSRYAAASILYPMPNWTSAQNVRSPAKISNGASVYTPMVGPQSINTSSCGDVSTVGPIGLPVLVHCVATG